MLQPPPQQQPPTQSPAIAPQSLIASGIPQLSPPPTVAPNAGALLNGPPPTAVDAISSLPPQLAPVLDQLSHSSLAPLPVFTGVPLLAPQTLTSGPPQEIQLLNDERPKVS